MSALNFPRSCKSLLGSKVTATKTGVTLATPWGSFLDFDASHSEAAELAAFFGGLAALFDRHAVEAAKAAGKMPLIPEVVMGVTSESVKAEEPVAESVEASEAFPDVEPHVVALPKVKRAYRKRGAK